jgi:hypothetical protein
MPVCTSSNRRSRPCRSHKSRKRTQERRLDNAHAAFAHDRLDQDRRGLIGDRALGRLKVGKRHLVEAVDHRTEAVEILFLTAGGQRRQRPAVESALESDDAIALGMAARGVVFARGLDGAFHGFGAGIAEEHHVGKARLAQPPGYTLGLRNLVEVGDVPELLRLLGDGGDQMRMRVAERVDGDAGGKIQVTVAVCRNQPSALTPLKGKVDARVGRQQMRCHVKARSARSIKLRSRK